MFFTAVLYFDQISGVAHTQKLVKILFLVRFQTFSSLHQFLFFLSFSSIFQKDAKKGVLANPLGWLTPKC